MDIDKTRRYDSRQMPILELGRILEESSSISRLLALLRDRNQPPGIGAVCSDDLSGQVSAGQKC